MAHCIRSPRSRFLSLVATAAAAGCATMAAAAPPVADPQATTPPAAAAPAMLAPSAVEAPPRTIDLSARYIADIVGVASGGGTQGKPVGYLDNLDLTATANLDRLVGWTGATFYVHILNNLGSRPNDRAVTLQGVDNIEVASHRLRLYQAWVEQTVGTHITVRAGVYDLNSEFYVTDAAGLLHGAGFGMGSEIAATGPNGPSIFPSTALAVRVNRQIGRGGFVRAAVLNAQAGTLGGPAGLNLTFDNGALLTAEAGIERRGKLALGVWGYTRRQDDIRERDAGGQPRRQRARGAYVMAQWPLATPDAARPVAAFAKIGLSDGRTTSFSGGWQTGVLIDHVLTVRPDSRIAAGISRGLLSTRYRATLADADIRAARGETGYEITFSDRIAPYLTVQPDVQWVMNPAGDRARRGVLVIGLRLIADL